MILNSNVQSNSASPGAPRPWTARNDRPTVQIVVSTTSGIKHCPTDTACPFKVLIANSSHPGKLRNSQLTNGSPPNCKAFGDWSQLLISRVTGHLEFRRTCARRNEYQNKFLLPKPRELARWLRKPRAWLFRSCAARLEALPHFEGLGRAAKSQTPCQSLCGEYAAGWDSPKRRQWSRPPEIARGAS